VTFIEGWHYGIQARFLYHHPTRWNFVRGLKKCADATNSVFTCTPKRY